MSSHPIILAIKSKLIVQSKGTNTSLSAFALFRKAAAAKPGRGVDFNGFVLALKQFGINAKENNAVEAFNIIKGPSSEISFKQFRYAIGKDIPKSIMSGRKFQAQCKQQLKPMLVPSVRSISEKDTLNLTGVKASTPKPSSRSLEKNKKQKNPMKKVLNVEGHRFTVEQIFKLLRVKIAGRNPGGSYGLLHMWKQFRHLAGASRRGSGTRGAGSITMKELGLALKHYGVPLNQVDLKTIMDIVDTNRDGSMDYMEWQQNIMNLTKHNISDAAVIKERPKRKIKFTAMELQTGNKSPKEIFILLRQKMAMHQRGAPLCKKPTWRQFRSKSGADRKGVKSSQFHLAMKYYGMPMARENSDRIFKVIDFKNDGVIDYEEFVGVVLGELDEWKPLEGTLEAPVRYRDDIDTTQTILAKKEETESGATLENDDKSDGHLNIDPSLLEMEESGGVVVPPLDLANDEKIKVISNTAVIPDLKEIKNSIIKKLSPIAAENWRNLQIMFRKVDTRRKGYISKLQFAGIFANFDVVLDESELEYILSNYGTRFKKPSRQMMLNRSQVYHKNEPIASKPRLQQRPASAMSNNSTISSIRKNGGILYSKVLQEMLLGGEATNDKLFQKSLMRSMSASALRGSNNRVSRYQSKYVVSAFDSDIHDLLY